MSAGPSPEEAGSSEAAGWQAAPYLEWPTTIAHFDAKERAAERLAATVHDGEVIGIGSGSSAYLALRAIGRRVREERLTVRVATTSEETDLAAAELGLSLARLGHGPVSWIVDGADEVDPGGRFLKGRGGALFKEKLLWASCDRRYVAVDATKHVARLGTRFPVPIEVHPAGVETLLRVLEGRGCRRASLRTGSGKDGPVITESGFVIVDARFDEVPEGLHAEIKALPGVLETGIFEGYAAEVIEEPGAPGSQQGN